MGMEGISGELWIRTKGAITNNLMEQSENGKDRDGLIFGYGFLLLFVDAVWVLYEAR